MDRTDTIDEFLARIASENVAPAGGSAAAVVGATGASLCEMVCVNTAPNGDAGPLADVRDELRDARRRLLDLAETDAAVIDDLFPAATSAASGIKRAIGVPLTIAEACLTVLDLAVDVTERGTRTTVGDAVTGVLLAHAALRASVFTVRSNLDYVSDASFVDAVERRAAEAEAGAEDAYDRAMRNVERRA